MSKSSDNSINFEDLARLSILYPTGKSGVFEEDFILSTSDLDNAFTKIPKNDILRVESDRLNKAFKKLCLLLHIDHNNFKSKGKKNGEYEFDLEKAHLLLRILQNNHQYNILLKNGVKEVFSIDEYILINNLQTFIEKFIEDRSDQNNAMSIFTLKFELNSLENNPIYRISNILFKLDTIPFYKKKTIYEQFLDEIDEITYDLIGNLAIYDSKINNYDISDLIDTRIILKLTDAKLMVTKNTTNSVPLIYYSELIHRIFKVEKIDIESFNGKDFEMKYHNNIVKKYKKDLIDEINKALKEIEYPDDDIYSKFIRIDK
ncbi:hypothetical protein ACN5ZK_03660 [Macrococcoides bohemicum]|uniref:hypothetical protein n=1 Tax=Macrococcoides bohemicum TaxID=1903056 RepID=UPI003AFF67FD